MSAADCFKTVFVPGATGHEPVNAYLLMMANRLVFPDQIGAIPTDRADFERRFLDRVKPLGMDAFTFFHDLPGARFDTNAVIMSNDQIVVVAFRGTEFRATWAKFVADLAHTDLDIGMVPVTRFGAGVEVHGGFWKAFRQVSEDVLSAVRDQGSSRTRLWVTGHSLGGAQAVLVARSLREKGVPVQGLYTFGAPRVGNQAFKENLGIRNVQRYVYALDLVPMMPDDVFLGYRHVGRTNNIVVPLLPGAGPYDSDLQLGVREVRGLGNLGDHDLARYEAALFHQLSAGQQAEVPKPALRR